MEDRESQHNRLTEPHRSMAAKIAWKRHHSSYARANRKKERDSMNKTFYGISKELGEMLNEEVTKDDMFNLECQVAFDTISGAVGISINKDNANVSLSTNLLEKGHGNYKLETTPETDEVYKRLYEDLKDEFETLCSSFDTNVKQILAKHGLRTIG